MSNKNLNKIINEIIDEILKENPELLVKRNLKYDEPSLHRPDDITEDKKSQIDALQKELNILNQQLSNANSNKSIPTDRKSKLTKSLQDRIKRKKERIDSLKKSDIDESSTSAGIAGYETPFAFSKPSADPKKKRAVQAMKWPVVEAPGLSSWEKFLLTIEATAEGNVREFLFDPLKEPYIDTPGDFHLQHKGTSNITSYMKRNMGSSQYNELYKFYKKYKSRCDAFVKKFSHTVDIHESKIINEVKSGESVTIKKDGKLITIDKLKNVKNINDLQKFGLDVLNSPGKRERIKSGEKVIFLASPTRLHTLIRTQDGKVGTVTRDMISENINFKDEELSPKKKIAYAVKGMREQLQEIEKVLDKSVNFKEEAGLKTSDFYKRTHNHLRKIGEQVTRIMNKMQAIK